MLRITSFMAVACLIASAAPAAAQSSKAAWRFENIVSLSAAADTVPGTDLDGDTGWAPILTTHIKTPNGKELAIGVSLQCGIVTDTTVRSKGGDLDSAEAQGRIKVLVKITQPDGSEVWAKPDSGADLSGVLLDPRNGVTYCDRYQKLVAKFAGLNCVAEQGDGDGDGIAGEVTCEDPEELQLILKTLNAHHFNFLHANAVPGVQKVEVFARAEAAVALGGTSLGAAGAEAFAGAGVLSVETIRLVQGANGTTDLTDLK
jgi:hypothetical protein